MEDIKIGIGSPSSVDVMLRKVWCVLCKLVNRIAQDVTFVLSNVSGYRVTHIRTLFAEQRLATKVAAPLRVLICDIHFFPNIVIYKYNSDLM